MTSSDARDGSELARPTRPRSAEQPANLLDFRFAFVLRVAAARATRNEQAEQQERGEHRDQGEDRACLAPEQRGPDEMEIFHCHSLRLSAVPFSPREKVAQRAG